MTKNKCPLVTLANGVKMPQIGFGVMKITEGEQMETAIFKALEVGYRAFDNATRYGNEKGFGEAVKKSGFKREEIFITSKLRNSQQGYEDTLKAFQVSLDNMGLDYMDLFLIHWPVPSFGKYTEAWKAFEKLYRDGVVRAIGVSNFYEHHLKDIFNMCEIKPMVDQIEFHPYLSVNGVRSFCHENGIFPTAWSPLGGGKLNLLQDDTIVSLAKKYGKTPAQVILRWDIQSDVIAIPKSANPDRIAENFNIFDFEISAEDMKLIDTLNMDKRSGPHPDTFDILF